MRTTATFLTLLSFILSSATTAWGGLPPTTIQGQSDASAKPKFAFQVPNNQFTDLGGIKALVETGNKNLLPNASFESSTYSTGWTITTATGAVETSTVLDGKQSAKLTFSSSTGDIAQSVTPAVNTVSTNMEASCAVNTTMTTIQVCALSGGTEVACQNVPSSGVWSTVTTNFIGPANGTTVGVRVKTSASASGSFYADNCYVGPARNVSQVSQAQLFGTALTPVTTSCDWVGSATAAFANYSATSACPVATVTGNASAPGTKIPAITFASLPPGDYQFVLTGRFEKHSVAAGQVSFRLTDGTNNSSAVSVATGTTTVGVPVLIFRMSYTTAQSNITFQVQSAGDGTADGSIYADTNFTSGAPFLISVYKFPTSTDTAYSPGATPASWSGYMNAASGWSVTNTAFTDFGAGGTVVLTERQNRNMGTVSAAGSSLPGITFTPPRMGRYYVCAYVSYSPTTAGTGVGLQLTDGSTAIAVMSPGSASSGATFNTPVCGVYNSASGAAVTLKLQGRSGSSSVAITTGGGNTTGNAIEWSVIELDAPMPAPYLTGSVTSTTTGAEHVERAYITNNGTCTVNNQSGSWISSVSHTGTATCTVTITTGEFSAAPACFCQSVGNSSSVCAFNSTPTTATTVVANTFSSGTGSGVDVNFYLMCMGPR